jgi:hypothetical protein
MPFLRERFHSFAAYDTAGIQEIYGDRLRNARELRVNTLLSTVFLNRGDRFEARPLPPEAQWSPAFAVCVGDLDGDGNEDLFLSQNFFANAPDTSRHDAGRGLFLRGDGEGGFTSVSGDESGLKIYGEQRGAALSDYDHDGRIDLVVTQNGAETKLFHNVSGKPGLRVQLAASIGNEHAVGAVIRAQIGGIPGLAREVKCGSGYWSSDSTVQILNGSAPITGLTVRWPGGVVKNYEVPPGAREVLVTMGQPLRLIR